MVLDQVEGHLTGSRMIPQTPVGVDRCVHNLIEDQVLQQPEAPAVSSWDGNLTYSLLHSLSSKLAQYLRTLGAGPEQVIPFCFERSL